MASMNIYGATPPAAGMACSPASWRSTSKQRVGSASRGPPRAAASATAFPLEATSFEDLLRRTRGVSTSKRRSVTSSPSGSPENAGVREGTLPLSPSSSLIVGFDLLPSHVDVGAAKLPAPRPVAKARGLLSKALDGPSVPTVPELSTPSFSSDSALFFPDVDMRPLKEAQLKHDVFRSELVATAYMTAARCYRGKVRKNGDPVLRHCLETASIVAGLGLDPDTVAAALLHEALRDGDAFLPQLEEFMPRSVVTLVERVQAITEVSQLYRNHRDTLNDEGLRRMLIAMEDVGAVLIKLADRVHNMRTVSALPMDRQIALARETLEVYSVVANRLGVWFLKAELEDSAFAVLHPAEFAALREQVKERQNPVALERTINTIKASLDEQGVKYEDISGRPKNLYGIWTKMLKDNKTLDEVHDVVALRVVVASKHDCYLALRAVQAAYRSVPNRHKDYIRGQRKANGYQSLHETVYGADDRPVEVQVRTHKMHYIAEYGFAAHWKYKEKLDSEDEWLDKQVQYKKWLTHYKLGVHDKKIRPNGSPPTDSSLKSLGFQFVDQAAPEHEVKVDQFLKLERFRLQPPPAVGASVLIQTQDTIESRQLPAGLGADELGRELGVPGLPGYVLLLNGRLPAAGAVLQSGDLVQVVPESAAYSRSPPRDVPPSPGAERQRQWQQQQFFQQQQQQQQRELDVFLPGHAQLMVLPLGVPGGGAGLASVCPIAVPVGGQ